MNKEESGFLGMVTRVVVFCQANDAEWKLITVFVKVFNKLLTKSQQGRDLLQKKESLNQEGFTSAKAHKFTDMKASGYLMSTRLASCARDLEDWAWLDQVEFSSSAFAAGSEKKVTSRCTKMADLAETHLTKLVDYKITAAGIAELRTLVTEYEALPVIRDNVVGEKKVAGQDLRADISAIREILINLDEKVEALIDDKNFRDRYKEARKLDNPGSGGSSGKTDPPK